MNVNLCKYKSALGEPKKGLHRVRIFGVAMFDVIFVLVIAWAIAHYFSVNVYITIAAIFALGIVAHRAFCVETAVDKFLF